jgi:hypothetical protein
MGSGSPPMTDHLWQMTFGSSPIHGAITTLCPLDVRTLRTPRPAGSSTYLQTKGAPLDVSHKADVASLLIRGDRVSAQNQKKITGLILEMEEYVGHFKRL